MSDVADEGRARAGERELRAVLVRRNPRLALGALVGAVVGPPALYASFHLSAWDGQALLLGLAAMWLAVGAAGAWYGFGRARRDDVSVRVLGKDVRAGTASLAGVQSGTASAMGGGRYRLDLSSFPRPRMRLEVDSASDARSILAALGLDRRAGTTRFDARWARVPTVSQAAIGLTAAMTLSMAIAPWPMWAALIAFATGCVLAWLLARVEVTVGSDGVHVRSLLRRCFVPHAEIEQLVPGRSSVTLVMRSGKTLALDTSRAREQLGVDAPDPVHGALATAWSSARGAAAQTTAGLAPLARGSRPMREWIAALRAIGSDGGGGYRVASVDEDELFALVGDAQAPVELRAAAAIALGANPAHLPRLRIAADDVAEPAVRRVVLAATAEAAGAERRAERRAEAGTEGGGDGAEAESALERELEEALAEKALRRP